jgi:hypothetical protein
MDIDAGKQVIRRFFVIDFHYATSLKNLVVLKHSTAYPLEGSK